MKSLACVTTSVFSLLSFLLVITPLRAGDMTDRFELTLARVLTGGPPHYTQDFLLADTIPRDIRRFTNFSGDLSGRYIGALSTASERNRSLINDVTVLVNRILHLQKQDGHFGDPMDFGGTSYDDMARLWGNGRMLIGLLEYYKVTGFEPALKAARRIGDFLVEVSPRFNAPSLRRFFLDRKFAVGYICWTQNIEGLTELYRNIPDLRYLQLAEQMAERIERRPSQHSHGLLSSLRGLVDLGRVTKKLRYLKQAESEWSTIVASGNLLVHGAIPESFLPSVERDEGCSQGDWIRLNLDLWRETADVQYLEQAERTLFNEFALNQLSSGDFGHVKLRKTGIGPEMTRAWWCCTLHGLRTFPDIANNAFRFEGETVYYDIPIDGAFATSTTRVTANSSLQRDANITLSVVGEKNAVVRLAVRLPSWAEEIDISIGGTSQDTETLDGYVHITKLIRPMTEVQLSYDLVTHLKKHPDKNDYAAVFRGPWLLGISESSTPSFFDEPYEHNRVALPNAIRENSMSLTPASRLPEPPKYFRVPAGHLEVEWIPAGYKTQPQMALLRPLAEVTSETNPTRWEFWFKGADASIQPLASTKASAGQRQRTHLILFGSTAAIITLIVFLLRRLRASAPTA